MIIYICTVFGHTRVMAPDVSSWLVALIDATTEGLVEWLEKSSLGRGLVDRYMSTLEFVVTSWALKKSTDTISIRVGFFPVTYGLGTNTLGIEIEGTSSSVIMPLTWCTVKKSGSLLFTLSTVHNPATALRRVSSKSWPGWFSPPRLDQSGSRYFSRPLRVTKPPPT